MQKAIFLASFSIGVLQIILSYAAGVHVQSSGDGPQRFGYLECYNWSLTYLTVVPLILASCVPNTVFLYQRSRRLRAHRARFVILMIIALLYAASTAGREAWNALFQTAPADIYLEWTTAGAGDWKAVDLSGYRRFLWHSLFAIGYAHYFVASFFGFAGAFGTLWYFSVITETGQTRGLLAEEKEILFNQKIAVLAYLLYLVLLRSLKVFMSLTAGGAPVAQSSTLEFFKHGNAYLEAISGGILINILIGAFWILVMLVTHGLACQLVSPQSVSRRAKLFLHQVFDWISRAYADIGSATWFWVGVFLIGIVVPPPGIALLLAVAICLGGLQLIRLNSAGKRERDS